jgi:hypothetical protein
MSGKENAELVDQTGRHSLDPKQAPIVVPAGSYDVDDLKKGLNAVSRSAPDKRADTLDKAFEEAKSKDTDLGTVDGAAQADYEIISVKHPILDITEELRVYKPKTDEAVAADSTGDTKE